MTIQLEDVKKVALLSRLELNEQELQTMTSQMAAILDYVEQLQELDTDGVEPMAHAIEMRNVFRDDVPTPSLPREQSLANAPDQDGEFFRVPAILGE